MATNQTEHYALNQWKLDDSVVMADFNADNQKVDAALNGLSRKIDEAVAQLAAAIPYIRTGTYTGTGTWGADSPNALTFDFTPKLVIISQFAGDTDDGGGGWTRMIAVRGTKQCYSDCSDHGQASPALIHLIWNGNTLSWYSTNSAQNQGNRAGVAYHYIAIG